MVRLLTVAIDGPLASHAAGFLAVLTSQGYTPLSAANQLRLLACLSRWLERFGFDAGDLTKQRVESFLRSRRRAGYTCWRTLRGMDQILRYLRAQRAAPVPLEQVPRGALHRLLARYEQYLNRERGLAASTRRSRLDVARRFFLKRSASPSAIRTLSPTDVREFLQALAHVYSPPTLAGIGSHLRSLLRFLLAEGLIRRSLADAVPSAVGWRDRALPQGISTQQVGLLLRSCDRRRHAGRRDFAILLLLSRLGLRAGEVVTLTLDDIDWRRAELVIHGKGSKRELLPLPHDVGAALSSYLRNRPDVSARQVFLRERAPHRPLRTVGAIVFAASRRARIPPVWPHRLRRTAATQMLRRGASLRDIAEVLRHTSTQTTAMYAKVDRRALSAVVQRWPGARS